MVGRHRRVYEPTRGGPGGPRKLAARAPVASATVGRDLGLHLMRFVMMEHLFPRDEVLGFLRDLAAALTAFTAGLERYAATADLGDRQPSLALDHGLAVHRASLQWAERAIASLSALPAPSDLLAADS